MQRALKAKVTYLLKENLEAEDASDEIGDMNESQHLVGQIFSFLYKISHNTC